MVNFYYKNIHTARSSFPYTQPDFTVTSSKGLPLIATHINDKSSIMIKKNYKYAVWKVLNM